MALNWENLGKAQLPYGSWTAETWRTPVPGGWLVMTMTLVGEGSSSTVFLADPQHEWDGNSLHVSSIRPVERDY